MRSNRLGTLLGLLATLASSTALADGGNGRAVGDLPAGQEAILRGVQGPAGMFNARIFLGVNLSADLAGKPVSLAPDLYYSATDRFQIGLLHTGPMGWQTRPGTGICFTGESNGCPHIYNNLGFDLMYALLLGEHYLSAHGSFYVRSFADPAATMLTLGLTGKVSLSRGLALLFDPQLGIGVSGRDEVTGTKESLFVPVELQVQATPALQLKLFTGLSGALDRFGDVYEIPLGIGGLYNVDTHVDLGLRFSFDNLLGKVADGVGRADTRSLSLLLAIRG